MAPRVGRALRGRPVPLRCGRRENRCASNPSARAPARQHPSHHPRARPPAPSQPPACIRPLQPGADAHRPRAAGRLSPRHLRHVGGVSGGSTRRRGLLLRGADSLQLRERRCRLDLHPPLERHERGALTLHLLLSLPCLIEGCHRHGAQCLGARRRRPRLALLVILHLLLLLLFLISGVHALAHADALSKVCLLQGEACVADGRWLRSVVVTAGVHLVARARLHASGAQQHPPAARRSRAWA